jgi:hypothetical protein
MDWKPILGIATSISLLIIIFGLSTKISELEKEVDNLEGSHDYWFNDSVYCSMDLNECRNDLGNCEYSKTTIEDFYKDYTCECFCGYPSFMTIAQNIAGSHEYILNKYDCTQFSDDLVRNLNKEGWESRKVIGNFNGTSHEWVIVEVPIEATRGTVIEPKVYEKYYER